MGSMTRRRFVWGVALALLVGLCGGCSDEPGEGAADLGPGDLALDLGPGADGFGDGPGGDGPVADAPGAREAGADGPAAGDLRLDRPVEGDGPSAPDLTPDWGPLGDGAVLPPCPKVCAPASGSTTCVAGRVFEARSLLKGGAAAATPVTSGSIQLKIYDLWGYNTHQPKAVTTVYDNQGCFIAGNVAIGPSGNYFIEVSGAGASASAYKLTGLVTAATKGKNVEDLEVPAVTVALAAAWANAFYLDATVVVRYVSTKTGKGVSGVVPTAGGATPPWPNKIKHYYLAADPGATPTVVSGASATTASGCVVATTPPSGVLSGTKSGCTIGHGEAATPVPRLHFVHIPVSGC